MTDSGYGSDDIWTVMEQGEIRRLLQRQTA